MARCLGLDIDAPARRVWFRRSMLPNRIDWTWFTNISVVDATLDQQDRLRVTILCSSMPANATNSSRCADNSQNGPVCRGTPVAMASLMTGFNRLAVVCGLALFPSTAYAQAGTELPCESYSRSTSVFVGVAAAPVKRWVLSGRRTSHTAVLGLVYKRPVGDGQRYQIHAHLEYPGGHLESEPFVFTATTGKTVVTLRPDAPRTLHP